MDDDRNCNFITLTEKARNRHSHHQVFPDDDVVRNVSDFGFQSRATYRGAPARQRIRKLKLCLRVPTGIRANIRQPQGSVGKQLPDFWLNWSLRFQLCQRSGNSLVAISEKHLSLPCLSTEVKRERRFGGHTVIHGTVEKLVNIAACVWIDRVNGLVHYSNAELSRYRLSFSVADAERVTRLLPGLKLLLRRLNFNLKLLLNCRNFQVLIRLIKTIVFPKSNRNIDVRLIVTLNRNVNGCGKSCCVNYLSRLNGSRLGRYQQIRFRHAGHDKDVRGFPDFIRFLIRHHADLA